MEYTTIRAKNRIRVKKKIRAKKRMKAASRRGKRLQTRERVSCPILVKVNNKKRRRKDRRLRLGDSERKKSRFKREV
jgi:hypothetical protein